MFLTIRKQNCAFLNRLFLNLVLLSFIGQSILPSYVFAQSALNLPEIGTRVNVSEAYSPALIKGLKVDPQNPLKFDFIIDTGSAKLSGEALRQESNKLIRYFLSALAVPDDELWVNLSPIEKDRIIADGLVKTEMGRDMLAQDYLLKQITASLVYPEAELGRKFWSKVRQLASERMGTTDIPMDTFNKVWIVPQNAMIYETSGTAFVVENRLKVMLEEDYLALEQAKSQDRMSNTDPKEVNSIGSQIVREIVLPELEKDVNAGRNFANLRQIANAVVLAWWYKQNLRESLLGKVYVDQNKVQGIDLAEKDAKLKIYNRYLEALKVGVYNYIKEDLDPATNTVLPRKYFSGGTALNYGEANTRIVRGAIPEETSAQIAGALNPAGSFVDVESITVENSRLVPVAIPQDYDGVLKPLGLTAKSIEAISLRGDGNPGEVVDNLQTLTVLRTSLAQAIAAILFAGTGKDGKVAADANAVEMTLRTVMDYIANNPNDAIVVRADEGARDESVSLIMGRIYYQGYANGHADFGEDHAAYQAELDRLTAAGVRLHFFAGDALEKTNGLAHTDGVSSATDSWALASLADDTPDYRLLVDDNYRIAGVSFNATTDAGVEPFDLPSVAVEKIARARGIATDSPAFAEFVNHLIFVTLGAREAEYVKAETQSNNHRHKQIIDDAIELKKKFPGLEIRTPGDGDLAPRVVSSLGLDLDGRLMITAGRSGSAEATMARLVSALVSDAQFNNRFVSEKATSGEMILANADQYTPQELQRFVQLGYTPDATKRTNLAHELSAKGSFAMTAVTGASEWLFGKSFAGLMPRVTINREEGTVVTHTLVVTPTGNVYVVRSTFKSDDIAKTLRDVVVASLEARDYVAKFGDAFVNNLIQSRPESTAAASVVPVGSREESLVQTGVAISFGTSGWRGKNGGDFVLENILRAAQGTASYVLESGKKKVIVGYDTREGNPTFSKETAALLAANGIEVVYVNAAATPTPALALLAQQLAESDADFGGVINFTASHSPAQDNGFKFSPSHGGAADKAVTDRITALANGAATYRTMDYGQAKEAGLIVEMDARQVIETYKNYAVGVLKAATDKQGVSAWDSIVNYFRENPSKRIILDPMQGTSVEYLRAIYTEIAQAVGRADLITIINTNNADSKFLDVNGRPQPDAKESHKNLLDEVMKNQGNALGISTDGDADRFGFIDFNGKFVSADDLIGLLAYFLKGDVGLQGAIGKTVVTSDFSNRVAEHLNSPIDELPVGFKWFVEQTARGGQNYAVAGEESAHVMVGPFAKTWDDGIAVGLTVLWMVARSGNSLGEYKENVEKLLDVRYLTSVKTIRDDVKGEQMKKDLGVKISAVKAALNGRAFASLSEQEKKAVPYVGLIEEQTGMKVEDIVLKDGAKFVMSGGSLAMRPSGTEPAVKVYVQAKQVLSKDAQGTEAARNRDVLEAVGKSIIGSEAVPVVSSETTVAEEDGELSVESALQVNLRIPPVLTEFTLEKAGGRTVGDRLHQVLDVNSASRENFLKGGYGQPGYGVAAGAVNDGNHALGAEGDQGYYVDRTNVPDGRGGFKSGQQVFLDTTASMSQFFKRRGERNGKPIRLVIKTGIGGQHTPFAGIASVFQTVDQDTGIIVGEYELGKDFESSIAEMLGRLNADWSQVAVIPSSKSGSTDETMTVFVEIFRLLLNKVAQANGMNGSVFAQSVMDYLHTINFDNGKEVAGADLFKKFDFEELVALAKGVDNKVTLERARQTFAMVLGNMFFETTDRPRDSRLSAFIRNSGLDRTLGEDAPGFGAMFDNVGGRWTGDLHMMTFLAFYGLDAQSYWQVRREGIERVRQGMHEGNQLGDIILDHGISKIALVVPDELFWFGKATEQNFNESIWQSGFANLRAIRESVWAKQSGNYTDINTSLVINLSGLSIGQEFNVVNVRPVDTSSKQTLAQEMGRLFTTFYGMTYTVGNRLIDRALANVDLKASQADMNDLENQATQVIQQNLFLRQPYVELGKGLLEGEFNQLQAAQAQWTAGGRVGISPIEQAVKNVVASAVRNEAVTNVEGLREAVSKITDMRSLAAVIKEAALYARSQNRTFVPFLYLEGDKFLELRRNLEELGVEWVLQGTGDQHISYQQVLANPEAFLPFFVSFVPEEDRFAAANPAIGFVKGYLDNISPNLQRDYFAQASYQALTIKRAVQNGQGVFVRMLDTDQNRGMLRDAFSAAMNDEEVLKALNQSELGGINLNPKFFNLQIKRDGEGIPFPVNSQPVGSMRIDGFVPVIIKITPLDIAPLLGGVMGQNEGGEKLSYNR